MTSKILHNFTWIPLMLIGLTAIGLGIVWCCIQEPWLMDKSANEALLQTSFDNLFSESVNRYFPDYLRFSYRFFGLLIISIGLLLIAYVFVTRMGTTMARNVIHFVVFIFMLGLSLIAFVYIPTSPFNVVLLLYWLMWFISVLASIQLKKYD